MLEWELLGGFLYEDDLHKGTSKPHLRETAVSDRTMIMAGRQHVKNNVWKFGIGIGEASNLVVFVSLQVI